MIYAQGFIKAIVGPLYKTFSKIDGFDLSECMTHLAYNAKYWKKVVHDEENSNTPRYKRTVCYMLYLMMYLVNGLARVRFPRLFSTLEVRGILLQ